MEKNASTIKDIANGQQSAVHSFLQQFAKPKGEEAANHGPDDRFDAICVAFTKQMVHDIDGTLNATHKLIRVKKAMKRDLETILTGNELNRAKQQSCYARLQILLQKNKPTISAISVPAMQLGKLIHEEQCQEDFCPHCKFDFKETITKVTNSTRGLMELYEIASSNVISTEKDKKEKQSRGARGKGNSSQKTYPASMFTIQGFPRNFRYRSEMVSCIASLLFNILEHTLTYLVYFAVRLIHSMAVLFASIVICKKCTPKRNLD